MASTRFQAMTLSVGARGRDGFRPAQALPCFLPPLPAQVPLTVGLFLQVSQAGRACKDVCLAIKTLSEGVAATGKHIVEHAACREYVHCAGLGARGTSIRRKSLLQEVCRATFSPGLIWQLGIWLGLGHKDTSQEASSWP